MHEVSRALSFKRKRRWGNSGCRREISDSDDCMPVTNNSNWRGGERTVLFTGPFPFAIYLA